MADDRGPDDAIATGEATRDPGPRRLRIDLPLDRDDDLSQLRGALLAARATELSDLHRRGFRYSAGYGSDSAREVMTSEVRQHRRRMELLDRLIAALPEE
jgi:hypothetical protein